ncbi:hypothetical protein PENSPDRAFT_431405 [Peniophora sp. CONT]|nr:hypothetical protein PENSPDRAFT_431405 [Peniophora sp. CONT]
MSLDQNSAAGREAGPPFADPDADLVLQSSDGVIFHVHRLLLAKCSPVFADILSLPTPSTSSSAVMAIADSERALRLLLDFCYHRLPSVLRPGQAADSLPGAIEDLKLALYLADKYHIDEMNSLALQALSTLVQVTPLRVYALAWAHRVRSLVLLAARASLFQPFTEDVSVISEFDDVPGTAVLRLLQYQQQCKTKAITTTMSLDWLTRNAFPGSCTTTHHPGSFKQYCSSQEDCPAEKLRTMYAAGDEGYWLILPWLREYFVSAQNELQKCPRGCSVETMDAMRPALKAASVDSNCVDGSCAEDALNTVPAMAKLLSAQVEKAIDEVSLNMPF